MKLVAPVSGGVSPRHTRYQGKSSFNITVRTPCSWIDRIMLPGKRPILLRFPGQLARISWYRKYVIRPSNSGPETADLYSRRYRHN